jgi:hypothetical protein
MKFLATLFSVVCILIGDALASSKYTLVTATTPN